ncbi:ATP-dependent nuclease [Aestuariirhabdus litorea]|uniref:DUF2813 domain-containing protein n=1 Tax=Aestuariirhabdus litorea TaxID=2528527 RepID=A0A3P3VL36_9GAMM|nr:AAA family ATPase [Aestuariirhabdus litorea]RRJ83390.1 DUF2813 domain-containing protein [Aestuariirhabdus litorea]RWW93551.1 DUF2813 domain-containing protein [Endozoicomonadaceae bacterium GTF-13]
MSLKIQKIRIQNFRSIREISISPGDLAVLVGKNDSGKSNVLRALNLFFNGTTSHDHLIDFESDHNVYNRPNRRAKEISVKIEFCIPENYRRVNGDEVVWEKRWRSEGLVHDKYAGRRRAQGPRGGVNWQEVEIPDRSNLHALLRNIKFVYVPAIKDLEYFSELRASIYDVIADVADREFRNSSGDFEQSIANQLKDLTDQISESLGFQSRLALPKNLSHIFESLDFLSDEQNISLDLRGDGVKARHIPLILKFMADKKRGLQGRGAQPYNFIWGYEEPENSLEISSSVELADQFLEFSGNGITQVLLTTHSPVFYNLHRKDECIVKNVSCHHVYRSDEDGTKQAEVLTDLDERMGMTALIAPMTAAIEDKVRRQEEARAAVEAMARANRRKIFVEGPSDKSILEKALRVFSPERAGEIDVETQNSAGFNYVIDMLLSWRSRAKHHEGQPRAAGLLDQDQDARKAVTRWNSTPNNVESAKCFKLPTPPQLIPALKAGFRVSVVLESIYDLDAWRWAEGRGYLEDAKLLNVVPDELMTRIVSGNTTLDENLPNDWAIFVKKQFNQAGKSPMSRYFSGRPDDEFRERFAFLEHLVQEIVNYLFPNEQAPE